MKELPMDVRQKLDTIFETIKETQSELSVAELGLIKKVTYYEADKTIVVYMNYPSWQPSTCPACQISTDMQKNSLERDIKGALVNSFPNFAVEFA